MIVETRWLIPALSAATGQEPILFWFVVAGSGIFLPLLITAALILKKERVPFRPGLLKDRLRFHRMNWGDWLWSLGAIVVIGIFSSGVMKGIEIITGPMEHQPPFMTFEPLTPERYWLLAVWLPYWVLNIMGEEILWRGTMLPRQELVFGKWTWLFHGMGWGLFHIAFGWQLLVTLLPMLLIQSYVVQRRKNTWIGVVIHGGINGPSFLAIAFGLL
ncbi:MAG: CPBP family intramembrane metalloprotease [Proteobacteria bacterium]|nr:CPBP family intramembrane metalloprotease [Pseudomonadota bacterium]MBU1610900.1 CPBP family intramembrane metalloprotease [Pseudomonadota bacterium]